MFLSPADNSHRPIWSCQRGVHTRPWRRVKRRRMASGSAVPSRRAVAICFYRHTAGEGNRSGWVASSSTGVRERRRGGQCWGVHAFVRPSLATGACGRTPADDQRHRPAGFAHDDQPSTRSCLDTVGHRHLSRRRACLGGQFPVNTGLFGIAFVLPRSAFLVVTFRSSAMRWSRHCFVRYHSMRSQR